jgi:hypothetical protein
MALRATEEDKDLQRPSSTPPQDSIPPHEWPRYASGMIVAPQDAGHYVRRSVISRGKLPHYFSYHNPRIFTCRMIN